MTRPRFSSIQSSRFSILLTAFSNWDSVAIWSPPSAVRLRRGWDTSWVVASEVNLLGLGHQLHGLVEHHGHSSLMWVRDEEPHELGEGPVISKRQRDRHLALLDETDGLG